MITKENEVNNKALENKKELLSRFSEDIILCNEQHLLVCNCQNELYKTFSIKYKEKWFKIIDEEPINEEEKQYKKNLIEKDLRRNVIRNLGIYCEENNIRCLIEKKEVLKTIEIFSDRYDLKDPRVFLILKSIISHQLSAHRMQLYCNHRGILIEREDRYGNVTYTLNPVEEAKRKYNEALTQSIEQLSKIIEGTKNINLNVDITPQNIKDVLGDSESIEKDFNEKRIIDIKTIED
jgi:hypothetical protein